MRDKLRELVGRWRDLTSGRIWTVGELLDELDALLAAEADEDEAVTVEWMDETLGRGWCASISDHSHLRCTMNGDDVIPSVLTRHSSVCLPPVRTRGEVRRLLRVLGVEVGKTNQETNG